MFLSVCLGSRVRNTHSAPLLVKQRRTGLIPGWMTARLQDVNNDMNEAGYYMPISNNPKSG